MSASKKRPPANEGAPVTVPNTPQKVRRGRRKRKPDGRRIADLVYGPVEPRAGKQLELQFDPEAPITQSALRFMPALCVFHVGRLAAHLVSTSHPVALAGYRHGKAEAEG